MKAKHILVALVAVLFLSQCKNKTVEQLTGIWQVSKADVNGTSIDGSTLGNWLWEFNDEGGYLVLAAGAKEKGTYKVTGQTLTLKSVTYKDRAETVYTISSLDSVNLVLHSESNGNKSTFTFIRKGEGEVGEDD
ncbi:MAG: lipocalin family protein [Chitinophagales bacterium]